MRIILLALLILIAGCAQEIPAQTPTETIRPAVTATVDVGVVNATNKETGIIFVISDYEKAARTSMRLGQTLTLPVDPQATITVLDINSTHAHIDINNETKILQEQESAFFANGALQFYLATSLVDTNE